MFALLRLAAVVTVETPRANAIKTQFENPESFSV